MANLTVYILIYLFINNYALTIIGLVLVIANDCWTQYENYWNQGVGKSVWQFSRWLNIERLKTYIQWNDFLSLRTVWTRHGTLNRWINIILNKMCAIKKPIKITGSGKNQKNISTWLYQVTQFNVETRVNCSSIR